MISILALIILMLAQAMWWRNSMAWVLLYLSGALFFIVFGINEDVYLAGRLIGDQHFFAANAVDECQGASFSFNDLRYSLYIYFISNSVFSCDYTLVAFFGKLSFALLWSVLIAAVAHYSFTKRTSVFWNHIALLSLIVLGWFFASVLLRDGLVALSLAVMFFPFLSRNSLLLKLCCFITGVSFLLFLRPQFIPLLAIALVITFFISIFKGHIHQARLFVALFFCGLLSLIFFPIPPGIGEIMANYLTPHGTTATANSRFTSQQVQEIFSSGGNGASNYLFTQIATRFPSVFYEPNPLRSLVWMLSRDELGSTHIFRMYNLIVSAMTELASWFFVVLIFWVLSVKKHIYNESFGKAYTLFFVLFVMAALVYVVKYLGFNHRVFLGFVAVGFVFFAFHHPTARDTRRIVLPALFFWTALQVAYAFLKPFDYIWNYL